MFTRCGGRNDAIRTAVGKRDCHHAGSRGVHVRLQQSCSSEVAGNNENRSDTIMRVIETNLARGVFLVQKLCLLCLFVPFLIEPAHPTKTGLIRSS